MTVVFVNTFQPEFYYFPTIIFQDHAFFRIHDLNAKNLPQMKEHDWLKLFCFKLNIG